VYYSGAKIFLVYISNTKNFGLGVILISRDKFIAIGMQSPDGEVHILKPVHRVLVKTVSVTDFILRYYRECRRLVDRTKQGSVDLCKCLMVKLRSSCTKDTIVRIVLKWILQRSGCKTSSEITET